MNSNLPDQDLRAFRIADVCRLCGLGRTLIFAEIKSGRLAARKCGRRTLILEDDLLKWLHALPNVQSEATLNSTSEGGGQ